jgi:hypothetical protein
LPVEPEFFCWTISRSWGDHKKRMILTLANLLSRGYFPGELPPPFTTTQFAKAVTAPGVSFPIDFTKRKNEWCQFTSSSLAQPGSLRRRLVILNPIPHFRLASAVLMHQEGLLKKARASHLSLLKATVHGRGTLGRSGSFDDVPQKRALVASAET